MAVRYRAERTSDVLASVGDAITGINSIMLANNITTNMSNGYAYSEVTACVDGAILQNITRDNETLLECVMTGPIKLDPVPLWQMIVFGPLAVILCIMTILGNLIVILSFIIERAIRQPTNYFIASLACSDLLIGLISMPFYTIYLLTNNWVLGEILCDLWLSCDYTVCLTSIYTVFCITIDRYCMVKLPARYRAWRTENKVLVIIALTWIVPTVVFFTSIFGWQYFDGERTVGVYECHVQYMEEALFNAILQICYFWVTLLVMIVLYTGVYKVALDMHRKSQAKKTKMTSLVSMAGHTMTKIGIGMSQQKTIPTKNLLPPKAMTKTDTGTTGTTRLRGASTTSFSSNLGDRDERSSSPAYPSDTDHNSNSPGRQNTNQCNSKGTRSKKKVFSKTSTKAARKTSKVSLSKQVNDTEMKSEKQTPDTATETPDDLAVKISDQNHGKAAISETVALLSEEAILSDSSGLKASSGVLSNVACKTDTSLTGERKQGTSLCTVDKHSCDSDRDLTINEQTALVQNETPCIADNASDGWESTPTAYSINNPNCTAYDINNASDEPVGDFVKHKGDGSTAKDPIGTQITGDNTVIEKPNNSQILQGLKYIDQDFLKSLQSKEGIKLINDITGDNLLFISTNEANPQCILDSHGIPTSNCCIQSPVWKRRSCILPLDPTIPNGAENVDQFTTNNTAEGCAKNTITDSEGKKHSHHNSETNFQYPCNGSNSLHQRANCTVLRNGVTDSGQIGEEACQVPYLHGPRLDLTETGLNTKGGVNNVVYPVSETSLCMDVAKGHLLSTNQLCQLSNGNSSSIKDEQALSLDNTLVISENTDITGQNGINIRHSPTRQDDKSPPKYDQPETAIANMDPSCRLVDNTEQLSTDTLLPPPPPPPSYNEALENYLSPISSQPKPVNTEVHEATIEQKPDIKDKKLLSPSTYQKRRTTSTDSFERSTSSSYNSKASDNQEITQESDKPNEPLTCRNKTDQKYKNKKHRRRNGSTKGPIKSIMQASKRKRTCKESTNKQKSKSENRARKAFRTITIILGAFVICWTPWHILSMLMGFGVPVPMLMYNISYWLCYLNSPINPFCYAFANQQFKKTFLRILRLDWHKT